MSDIIGIELSKKQFAVLLACLNQIEDDLLTKKSHYTPSQLKVLPALTQLNEHIKQTARINSK